ncbi:MAG: hypothetical protein ACI4AL_06225 [Aristaeellaceae bacterium]
MAKLTVEIDGKQIGKLTNGHELSTSIDEQAHELHVHFGVLGGKKCSTKLMIPAGSFSYALQVEMLELTTGNKPVLVPCGGSVQNVPPRVVQLMVSTLTTALMDQKLRDIFIKVPGVRLQLVVEEQQWGLVACAGTARKTLLVQPYSQIKGSLLAAMNNYLEHADLHTPEGREKFTNMIFTEYLQYLPDYQQVGNHEFVLKTVL